MNSEKAADADSHDLEAIPLVAVVDPASPPQIEAQHENNKSCQQKRAQLSGLTKEELEAFVNDPFWHRLRLITLILFCIVWLCMFAAVIVIVVASPKCPPRPTRQFWQRPVYRFQLPAFAPASGDDPAAVGSVAGLVQRLGHLRDTLGVSNLLLGGRLLPVGPSGCPADFAALRPEVGTLESLKSLTKTGRKKGFNLIMEMDLSQADPEWAAGDDSVFATGGGGGGGGSAPLLSRDGRPAWSGGRLHLPRSSCNSLNVTAPAAVARLESALTFWLNAGLSGFLLTNVAFMMPSASSLDGLQDRKDITGPWFKRDPSQVLYSNASVQFVRQVRQLLNRESGRLGRDLALFVDPGNTGFPQPIDRLAAYLDPADGAHAVVSVGLGQPLSDQAVKSTASGPARRRLVESMLAAAAGRGSFIFATAWPSLRRPSDPLLMALSLTLPGVPCLYYGQELGMAHVPGVRYRGTGLGSYLDSDESTDASETPMQWADGAGSAGWLANGSARLDWIDLAPRAADIRAHNLRLLAASGHPQSALQFAKELLGMAATVEALQWGNVEFLAQEAEDIVVAFRRRAVRYPAVLVVANSGAGPATVDLSGGDGAATGSLRLMHSTGGGGGPVSAYRVGESYPLDKVFVPGNTVLIFREE